LSGPLEVVVAHSLDADRLADRVRQNDSFVFGTRVAAVGAPIVTGSGVRVNGDLIGRDTEHLRDFGTEGLCVLGARMNVDAAVRAEIANGHGWPDGSMFEIGALVSGFELLRRAD